MMDKLISFIILPSLMMGLFLTNRQRKIGLTIAALILIACGVYMLNTP